MLILVAEDNHENSDILQRRLTRKGYDVVVAFDGSEAVKVAELKKPDLILMDISMPIMSGIEATQQIRLRENIHHVPIIALTAHAMEGDREKCVEAGCNDFATKPVNFKALLGLLEKYLGSPSEHNSRQAI